MSTTVKRRIKKRQSVFPVRVIRFKKKKNPIELFGILKDKIFYESDEVLMSGI